MNKTELQNHCKNLLKKSYVQENSRSISTFQNIIGRVWNCFEKEKEILSFKLEIGSTSAHITERGIGSTYVEDKDDIFHHPEDCKCQTDKVPAG